MSLADYSHHGEDAAHVWWAEEGRHHDDEPPEPDDDWRDIEPDDEYDG